MNYYKIKLSLCFKKVSTGVPRYPTYFILADINANFYRKHDNVISLTNISLRRTGEIKNRNDFPKLCTPLNCWVPLREWFDMNKENISDNSLKRLVDITSNQVWVNNLFSKIW